MFREKSHYKRIKVVLLLLMVFFNLIVPWGVCPKAENRKVVRVGWHEPPYFMIDEYGRRSGYSYEYQRKVAAYTGWEYEYIEGSWSELLDKLKKGEIDLMSNVSYSEERAKDILYTSLPMGTEAYYIYVSPSNTEISADNISALNGKKVGVTKNSIQKDFFVEWADIHDVKVDLIETTATDEESFKRLGKDYDAFVTIDVYGNPEIAAPVCKIGSSDFFFAVSKHHPDLLNDLDAALNRIQDENKYYDQQLHDKYLRNAETSHYFSADEIKWLDEHRKIRVGYQDNYLAFCAKNPDNGELTGALSDILEYSSTAFENADVAFEPVCYESIDGAIEALQKGEVDCIFPSNMTDYDAEQMNLVITPTVMRSEMDAIVREEEQKEFVVKENVVVAVNEGNTNYDLFLADHYPKWQRMYFKDTPSGLDAVAAGKADCVIISNYRYSNVSKQCEKLHLTSVYTGVDMDFSFAVREGDTKLYSVLSKIIEVVPNATVHSALTYYSTEDVKTGIGEIIKDNIVVVIAVCLLIALIILILLLRSIKAERKVAEEEYIVKDLNKRVYVDALTSVRNKGGYNDFMQKLQTRLNDAESEKVEFAIGIFDCNDLKKINDRYGHEKGDVYLKNACHLICKVFQHSPVFRIGGDEFAVVLQNEDFNNREELVGLFETRQSEVNASCKRKWEEIHVAYGIAVYDDKTDITATDTAARADKLMYENKKAQKEKAKK